MRYTVALPSGVNVVVVKITAQYPPCRSTSLAPDFSYVVTVVVQVGHQWYHVIRVFVLL